MKKIKVNLGINSYNIFIGSNLLSKILQLYPEIKKYEKIHVITDETVEKLYLKNLVNALNKDISVTVIKEGEQNKSLETLQSIIKDMLNQNFDRSSLIIALGGGVVGDVSGFTASIYMRGIDFIQIPTTLLSQVDSSVGGKTAVNFNGVKNIVGTFYQPKFVLIDTNLLKTIDNKNVHSGIGEIIKYGIIQDYDFFRYIKANSDLIEKFDEEVIEYTIYKSINIKKEIVQKDEKESNIRMILNFGHTVGHGIELLGTYNLYHGEAVLIGMVIESLIAYNNKLICKDYYYEIKELVQEFISIPKISNEDANIIYSKMLNDKKNENGHINIVLPINKGEVKVFTYTDEKMIKTCLTGGLN